MDGVGGVNIEASKKKKNPTRSKYTRSSSSLWPNQRTAALLLTFQGVGEMRIDEYHCSAAHRERDADATLVAEAVAGQLDPRRHGVGLDGRDEREHSSVRVHDVVRGLEGMAAQHDVLVSQHLAQQALPLFLGGADDGGSDAVLALLGAHHVHVEGAEWEEFLAQQRHRRRGFRVHVPRHEAHLEVSRPPQLRADRLGAFRVG